VAGPDLPPRARAVRLVPLTAAHDRDRLLAIAGQDMSAVYRWALARELDGVTARSVRGVCALEGPTPIGYAIYHRTVQTYALDTIAVDRARRRSGIGGALITAVRAALPREHPTILNAVTDAAARDVLAFYLGQGFHVSGYVADEFRPGVTQAHLTLEIP
jgi:GNAT superfamily N-acetyltransferase